MSPDRAKLAQKIISNSGFGLLDQILYKAGTTVAFILLVRLLPPHSVIAVGVAMGYLVFIAYLEIGLTRILLRDYPQIKHSRQKRNEHFTSYLVFWCLQTGVMLLLCAGIILFVLYGLDVAGLAFLFLGMTIDFIALAFQEWIKSIFYVDLRQKVATKVGFVLTCVRLVSYGILFFSPSLDTFTWILIGNACGNCIVWGTALRRSFQFRLAFNRRIPSIIRQSLNDYALWDHLNRTAIDTLLIVDTVILSLFGLLEDIGNYAIALKVTSLLFLVPWQLSRSLQVTLANSPDDGRRRETINTFLKLNGIVSFAQLAFMMVAGSWLIQLLFGSGVNPDAVRFTIIIAVGVTVMNLGWPLVAIINNLCSLRQAFLRVYLPGLIAGGSIYISMTWGWGATGIAYGKILAYVIVVGGLITFVRRHRFWSLKMEPITLEERQLLRELTGGLRWSMRRYTDRPG
jgi:O-antigen/teichoic acid export membrane protein